MRTTLKAKVRGRTGPTSCLVGNTGESIVRAIFVEPFLIVASALLWIIVLPFAALFCSGIAISDLVEAA